MTGLRRCGGKPTWANCRVSLRSVNHRGLDLHFHLGNEFLQFESAMRAMLKEHVGRGHVEIRVSLTRAAGDGGARLQQRSFEGVCGGVSGGGGRIGTR